MKIIFVSMVHPNKKSGANIYVKNLVSQIQKKIKIEIIWIVCEQNKIKDEQNEYEKIYDIRNFDNAADLLNFIKPDFVLADNNKFNILQHAISIASKFKKIPLVHFKVIEKAEENQKNNEEVMKLPKKVIQNMKKFFVDNNIDDDKKFCFNKSKYILYRHNFLYKTRSKINIYFLKNILLYINDFSSYFWKKQRMSTIADLQLVNNKDWMKYFRGIGFNENRLVLTGSPIWDPIYEKISNRNLEKINIDGRRIKILIITSPLVEHGYGTYSERDLFLKDIFKQLKSEKIDLEIKIHPSSETKSSYQKFLENNNLKIPIFQEVKLWDIIEKYDMVITYGYGYPQIECAFGGIRTILLKTKWNFPIIPIVNASINSGYFRICENLKDIIPTIHELLNEKIEINNEILLERENLIYKFDGKAGERATIAILDLLKKSQ
jgi:hypothetical protein